MSTSKIEALQQKQRQAEEILRNKLAVTNKSLTKAKNNVDKYCSYRPSDDPETLKKKEKLCKTNRNNQERLIKLKDDHRSDKIKTVERIQAKITKQKAIILKNRKKKKNSFQSELKF